MKTFVIARNLIAEGKQNLELIKQETLVDSLKKASGNFHYLHRWYPLKNLIKRLYLLLII